jgi:tRNA1(Val) A37 N6-methylase TrmN6
MKLGSTAATVDAFLGGRVEAVQPAEGHHRAGLEAVLLGASPGSATSGRIVDLGAGAGVAGFCVAARCAAASVVLVEREPVLVACAKAALARPANRAFSARVTVEELDIFDRASGSSLDPETADEVLINPPFYAAAENSTSPEGARARAHVLKSGGLDPWVRVAAGVLRPKGMVTVIFRPDGLGDALAALDRRFGAIDVLPLHPRAHSTAHRILVSARKGSRAGLRMLPPLILHGATGGGFLPPVDAVLREGRGLSEIHETWRDRR